MQNGRTMKTAIPSAMSGNIGSTPKISGTRHLRTRPLPRMIKGTEGRICLYRKAFSLDLCPPDFFLKVKDMARWRLDFSRQRLESKGKGKGKKGDDSSSDEEMTDAQRSEKDDQRKGKGKGNSRRRRAPTKVVEHIQDEDRDRMLQSIRHDLLELFKGSEDRLWTLSP